MRHLKAWQKFAADHMAKEKKLLEENSGQMDQKLSSCVSLNEKYLNPLTIYNNMDAVLMCCDWDPGPPNILESDKVMFFALNYIIT